jgi:hypothetical protein
MRFLKIKKVGAKKSCPVVHIHPTTPFSSCLRASKISKYRMANPNRGYVKLPNFKESSPTPAIPATHQSCTTTPEIYQKSFPANFTYQSSSLPETKKTERCITRKRLCYIQSVRELQGRMGSSLQLHN